MKQTDRRSLLPLTYIFGSFIGAAMIAVVFAYNNYRFSKYKFIDFSQMTFYEKSDIFSPKHDKYLLIVFSSNQMPLSKILDKTNTNLPIIAVDMFQKRYDTNSSLSYVSSDINTILKLINTLNITHIPSSVKLIKSSDEIYKQDSKIEKF
ncbi:hypothetical protein [Campylobacter mucosalis]|uniref:hypothetical protein n=1 Tax=Campylobacter mucosalis TaxID=202 RepID=UPI0014707762|nr:hypothetical protein [Campylobacter mucosalis]